MEDFFGGLDSFGRNFFGEIFLVDFFGRNSLFTLLKSYKLFEYGKELICLSRFWFLSRFCLNGEERKEGRGQEFRSLEVREASSLHLKIVHSLASVHFQS